MHDGMPDDAPTSQRVAQLEAELAQARARIAALELRQATATPPTGAATPSRPAQQNRPASAPVSVLHVLASDLAESLGACFWIRDVAVGRFLHLSPGCAALFGLSVEDTTAADPYAAPASGESAGPTPPDEDSFLSRIPEPDRTWLQTIWKTLLQTTAPAQGVTLTHRRHHPVTGLRRLVTRSWPFPGNAGVEPGAHGSPDVVMGVSWIPEGDAPERNAGEQEGQHAAEQRRLMVGGILDALPAAVFLMDTEGRYLYVNQHYTAQFGGSLDELVGRRPSALHAPDTAAQFAASDAEALRSGAPVWFEETLPSAAGDRVFLAAKRAVRDETGKPLGVCGVALDITPQKLAERRLAETSRLLDAIMAHSPAYIAIKNLEGRYLRVSASFAEAMGASSPEAVQGRRAPAFFDEASANACEHWDTRAIRENAPDIREMDVVLNGVSRRLLATRFPLPGPQGEPMALCIFGADVTALRHTQQHLRETSRLLDTIMEHSSAFIAIKDAQGRYLRVNRRYAQEAGRTPEEFVGRRDEDLFPPNIVAMNAALDRRALTANEPIVEEVVRMHDDRQRVFIATLFPLPAGHGASRRLCVIGTEITTLAQTHEALEETSATLDAIMEHSPSLIMIKDGHGRYVRVNRRFAALFDTTPEELTGKSTYDVTDPETAARFLAQERQVLDTGKPFSGERRFRLHGRERVFTVDIFALPGPETGAGVLCTVAHEVTEQARAQEMVAESERRFRAILESADNIAIQGYDEQRSVIYWNTASERIYGYTRGEALGRPLESLIIPPAMRHGVVAAIETWLTHGLPIPSEELVLMRKDGAEAPVYSAHVMHENAQGGKELYCIDVDLSEIKRMEQELRTARDMAEAANRAKSEFLANMSHEIRTPISGVMGMLQLLAASDLDQEASQYVQMALRACRTLTRLLSDILDLSRVEAGKLALQEEPFSPTEVLETITDTFRQTARAKQLHLHTALDPTLPHTLYGDPARLRQILMNLVGNAVKFTREGGVEILLTRGEGTRGEEAASASSAEGFTTFPLRIEVRDTGPGIPEERRQAVLEPFTQLEDVYSRTHEGAGLGLAIVSRLTSLMRGELFLESTPGHGAIFRIELPLRVAVAQSAPAREQAAPEAAGSARLDLLLVEDDPINREAMTMLLRGRGHAVVAVEDGRQALEALESHRFDCVVLDIQTPGLDGFEVLRRVRAGEVPGVPATQPIIALTAYAMREDERRIREAGADAFLPKPVHAARLFAALARLG